MIGSRTLLGMIWLAVSMVVSACASQDDGQTGENSPDVVSRLNPAAATESVPISGRLASEVAEQVIEALGSETPVILVLVRGSDCFTCEDLGRQLRELARAAPPGYRLVAVTDAEDRHRTEQFLMRERIRVAFLLGVDSFTIFQSEEAELPTPAVVIGSTPIGMLTGVAHPNRVPNYRPKSFAEELGLSTSGATASGCGIT